MPTNIQISPEADPSNILIIDNQRSSNKKQIIVHSITLVWNSLNNCPIYFNTTTRAWERLGSNLGFAAKALTDLSAGIQYNIGLAATSAGLLVFFTGSQIVYSKKLIKALWPTHCNSCYDLSNWPKVNGTINTISAVFKTEANTISMANFVSGLFKTSSISNVISTCVFSSAALCANLIANSSFYSNESHAKIPGGQYLSANVKWWVRHGANLLYSSSSALFYAMSLINFPEHIGLIDNAALGFDTPIASSISITVIIASFCIFLATHTKYNYFISQYLDENEESVNILSCNQTVGASKIIKLLATFFKAGISATSCFALASEYINTGLSIFLSAVAIPFTAAIQWVLFKQESSNSENEPLLSAEEGILPQSSWLTCFWQCLGYHTIDEQMSNENTDGTVRISV